MEKYILRLLLLLSLVALVITNSATAATLVDNRMDLIDTSSTTSKSLYKGYIGGVMVHLGYASGGELLPNGYIDPISINGMTMGIGGRMMFALGDHLRVGGEGYVSSMSYGENREVSLAWGGLSAETVLRLGDKSYLLFGATLGGGSYTNQCSLTAPTNDNTAHPTVWQSSALILAVPFVAMEYASGSSLRGIVKLDWVTAPFAGSSRGDFSSGPRLYIGVMFSKLK